MKAVAASGVSPRKIDERTIHRHLYAPDVPDPDLVIRTSGEFRISNFLLWELAYSELIFTDVLWPDFRREHLFEAVREFQARDRRYGTTGRHEDGVPS
jgi:undecaprenyl diphosphate synthase